MLRQRHSQQNRRICAQKTLGTGAAGIGQQLVIVIWNLTGHEPGQCPGVSVGTLVFRLDVIPPEVHPHQTFRKIMR